MSPEQMLLSKELSEGGRTDALRGALDGPGLPSPRVERRSPWVIVASDFRLTGGMDKANWALARYLLDRGTPVHFVAHSVEPGLAGHPLATVRLVKKPLQSNFLAGPFLAREGVAVWKSAKRANPQAILLANGGNCVADGVNWSHYVHHAWEPELRAAPWHYRLRWLIEHSWECRQEKRAYRKARLILTNSETTSRDVRRCLRNSEAVVKTVYLGGELEWGTIAEHERRERRQALGIPEERKIALFVGGIGFDNRKGFDVVVEAFRQLGRRPSWDVDLLVAGSGPAWRNWERYIDASGLGERIRMLGFSTDVRGLLSAADVVVSPARYEPYGLNVAEALARGVPVVASAKSGIAELFPEALRPLTIAEAGDAAECAEKLLLWREKPDEWRRLSGQFGRQLCQRDWNTMAAEMVALAENTLASDPGARTMSRKIA